MRAGRSKCLLEVEDYGHVFVGCWDSRVEVSSYPVQDTAGPASLKGSSGKRRLTFKDYKNIETKSDVRALLRYQIQQAAGATPASNLKDRHAMFASDEAIDVVICGQNEGYLDIIDLKTLTTLSSQRLPKVSHIYQMLRLESDNESTIALAAYNGLHFIKLLSENNRIIIEKTQEIYLKGQFCNRVIEFEYQGQVMLMAAVWGASGFHVIDRTQQQILVTIPYPFDL